MDFTTMKRRELQALCKKHQIPANLSNVAMANRLAQLFKEKENPLTKGVTKRHDEIASETESADVVVNRTVKKVRFSPENELIEFTRSKVNRRSRRSSVAIRNSATSVENVDSGEADNEDVGVKVMEKKRGREVVKGHGQKDTENSDDSESREGNGDNGGRVMRLRRKTLVVNVKTSGQKGAKRAKDDEKRDTKAIANADDVKIVEEVVANPGRSTRSRGQRLMDASTRNGKKGRKVVKNTGNVVPVSVENADKRGRKVVKNAEAVAQVGVEAGENRGVVREENLAGETHRRVNEIRKRAEEVTKNKNVAEVHVVIEPQMLRRSASNASRVDDSGILDGDTLKNETGQINGFGKTSTLQIEEPIKLELRRSNRRKHVVEPHEQLGIDGGVPKDDNKASQPTGVTRRSLRKRSSLKLVDETIDIDAAMENFDIEKHPSKPGVVERGDNAVHNNTRRSRRNASKHKSLEMLNEYGGNIIQENNKAGKRKRAPTAAGNGKKTKNDPSFLAQSMKERTREKPAAIRTWLYVPPNKDKDLQQLPEVEESSNENELVESDKKEVFRITEMETESTYSEKQISASSTRDLEKVHSLLDSNVQELNEENNMDKNEPAAEVSSTNDSIWNNMIINQVILQSLNDSGSEGSAEANSTSKSLLLGGQTDFKTDLDGKEAQTDKIVPPSLDVADHVGEFEGNFVLENLDSVEARQEDLINLSSAGHQNDVDNLKASNIIKGISPKAEADGFQSCGDSVDSRSVSQLKDLSSDRLRRLEGSNGSGNKVIAETSPSADNHLIGDQTDSKTDLEDIVVPETDKNMPPSFHVVDNAGVVEGISVQKNLDFIETRQANAISSSTASQHNDVDHLEASKNDKDICPEAGEFGGSESCERSFDSIDVCRCSKHRRSASNQEVVGTDGVSPLGQKTKCDEDTKFSVFNLFDSERTAMVTPQDRHTSSNENSVKDFNKHRAIDDSPSIASLTMPSFDEILQRKSLEADQTVEGDEAHVHEDIQSELADTDECGCLKNQKITEHDDLEFTLSTLFDDEENARIRPEDREIISAEYSTKDFQEQVIFHDSPALSTIANSNGFNLGSGSSTLQDLSAPGPNTVPKSQEAGAANTVQEKDATSERSLSGDETPMDKTIIDAETSPSADNLLIGDQTDSKTDLEEIVVAETDKIIPPSLDVADHVGVVEAISVQKNLDFVETGQANVISSSTVSQHDDVDHLESSKNNKDIFPKAGEFSGFESCDRTFESIDVCRCSKHRRSASNQEFTETDEREFLLGQKTKSDKDVEFRSFNLFDSDKTAMVTPQDRHTSSKENSVKDFEKHRGFDDSPSIASATMPSLYEVLQRRSLEADQTVEGDEAHFYEDIQSELADTDEYGCLKNHKTTKHDDWEFTLPTYDNEENARIIPEDREINYAEYSTKDFQEQVIFHDSPAFSTIANCNGFNFGSGSSIQDQSAPVPNTVPKTQEAGASDTVQEKKDATPERSLSGNETPLDKTIVDSNSETLDEVDEFTNKTDHPEPPFAKPAGIANTTQVLETRSYSREVARNPMCFFKTNVEGFNTDENENDPCCGKGKEGCPVACIANVEMQMSTDYSMSNVGGLSESKFEEREKTENQYLRESCTMSDIGEEPTVVESSQSWTEIELNNLFGTTVDNAIPTGVETSSHGSEIKNQTLSMNKLTGDTGSSLIKRKEKEMEGEKGSECLEATNNNFVLQTEHKVVAHIEVQSEENQLKLLFATPIKVVSPDKADESSAHDKELDRGAVSITECNGTVKKNAVTLLDANHEFLDQVIEITNETEQPEKPPAKAAFNENTILGMESRSCSREVAGNAMCMSNANGNAKTTQAIGGFNTDEKNDTLCGKDNEGCAAACIKNADISMDYTISNMGVGSLSESKFEEMEVAENRHMNLRASHTMSEVGEEPTVVGSSQSWTEIELNHLCGTTVDYVIPSGVNDTSSPGTELKNQALSIYKLVADTGSSITKRKEKEMEGERGSGCRKTTNRSVVLQIDYNEVPHIEYDVESEENQLTSLFATPIKIMGPCEADESSAHDKELDRVAISTTECNGTVKKNAETPIECGETAKDAGHELGNSFRLENSSSNNGEGVTGEELNKVGSPKKVNGPSKVVSDGCEDAEEQLSTNTYECLDVTNVTTIDKGTTPSFFSKGSHDDEVSEDNDPVGDSVWDKSVGCPRPYQDSSKELHTNNKMAFLRSPSAGYTPCQNTDLLPSTLELQNSCKETNEAGTTTQNADSIAPTTEYGSSAHVGESNVVISSPMHLLLGEVEVFLAGKPSFSLEGVHEKNHKEVEENKAATYDRISIPENHSEERFGDFDNDNYAVADLPASGCNEILKESDVADTIKEYIDSESSLPADFEDYGASLRNDVLLHFDESATCAPGSEEAAESPACVELLIEDIQRSTASKSPIVETKANELEEVVPLKEPATIPKTEHSPASSVDFIVNFVETKDNELEEAMPLKDPMQSSASCVDSVVDFGAAASDDTLISEEVIETGDSHGSSSKDLCSSAKKNTLTILIHGTPGKLLSTANMKENEAKHKSSNIVGDITTVRPPKRKALQVLRWK